MWYNSRMDAPMELKGAFRNRPIDANKYSVGTVAIVGGSVRYPHAPIISAMGARAAGAGLVHLMIPDTSRSAAGANAIEATVTKLTSTAIPPKADVTVVGMGLGATTSSKTVVSRILTGSCGRFVLDADALTILANWRREEAYEPIRGQEFVLTPHEGEAAKLLGWRREKVAKDRLATVREIVKRYGATVILKGKGTLVASSDGSRIYENQSGNPYMAIGGMGDLLAGMIGARWAYLKCDPFLVAASSVWLHGAAADALIAEAREPLICNVAEKVGAMRVRLDLQGTF